MYTKQCYSRILLLLCVVIFRYFLFGQIDRLAVSEIVSGCCALLRGRVVRVTYRTHALSVRHAPPRAVGLVVQCTVPCMHRKLARSGQDHAATVDTNIGSCDEAYYLHDF